ncbi:MAG: GNAT family N-acetyltransferase [Alphaproteobacteria bacterium]|nr:GNAT family N-acetyltransferase [Alphaproteobacteria bacterium]MBU0859849.1 GNAT family N-acetyltransferase [Alphaproteobacteria bacterium]
MTISIRPLDPPDWEIYRTVRLRALQREPAVFSSNYAKEAACGQDVWQGRLSGKAGRVFGVFDAENIIGLTGIFQDSEDVRGKTVMLVMSYLDKEYRGRGLSRLLYEARIKWAISQPQYERITVSHREGNESSRRANQSFGFAFTHKTMKAWPDGQDAEQWHYELLLKPLREPK